MHFKNTSGISQTEYRSSIVPLGVDETFQWFNSFFLVLKANGEVQLCLDSANKTCPQRPYIK